MVENKPYHSTKVNESNKLNDEHKGQAPKTKK